MAFGFQTFLDWIGNPSFADSAAHQDRNLHQAHFGPEQIPDPQDPDSPNCFVDDGFAYVREPWHEAAWNEAQGLHNYDADGDGREDDHAVTLRGIPTNSEAYDRLVESPGFDDHWQDVQAAYPDHDFGEPQPGLQLGYTGDGTLIGGDGTFDYASPLAAPDDHLLADVAPHYDMPYYAPADAGNGRDLSGLDDHSPEANVWPCSAGEFVGGPESYGGADLGVDHGGYDHGSGYGGDHGGGDSGGYDE